jgi:hypothetical protein
MTTVKRVVLPGDERGYDPDDHRDGSEFVTRLNGKRRPDTDSCGFRAGYLYAH